METNKQKKHLIYRTTFNILKRNQLFFSQNNLMNSTQILPAASVNPNLHFFLHINWKIKTFHPALIADSVLKGVHVSLPCVGDSIFLLLLISSVILGNLNSKHWKENHAFSYLIFNSSFPLCTLCLGSYFFFQKHKGNSSANLSTSHPSVMSALHLFCYVTVHRMFDADVLTHVVEQNEICCFLPPPPSKENLLKQSSLPWFLKITGYSVTVSDFSMPSVRVSPSRSMQITSASHINVANLSYLL